MLFLDKAGIGFFDQFVEFSFGLPGLVDASLGNCEVNLTGECEVGGVYGPGLTDQVVSNLERVGLNSGDIKGIPIGGAFEPGPECCVAEN